ncbi:MAG: M48 family metalloprotease [Lentisphaeraceae bacterium]|nr:M48 family metalloprotease [Lentisphaeraceae bacterium]
MGNYINRARRKYYDSIPLFKEEYPSREAVEKEIFKIVKKTQEWTIISLLIGLFIMPFSAYGAYSTWPLLYTSVFFVVPLLLCVAVCFIASNGVYYGLKILFIKTNEVLILVAIPSVIIGISYYYFYHVEAHRVLLFTPLCAFNSFYLWILFHALKVYRRDAIFAVAVSRQQCPELYALCDEVAQEIGFKKDYQLKINDHMNAYAGINRKGIPTRIILGLPMMHVLTKEELKGTLIHEFAHHFYNHMALDQTVTRVLNTHRLLKYTVFSRLAALVFVYGYYAEREADQLEQKIARGRFGLGKRALALDYYNNVVTEYWQKAVLQSHNNKNAFEPFCLPLLKEIEGAVDHPYKKHWIRRSLNHNFHFCIAHISCKERLQTAGLNINEQEAIELLEVPNGKRSSEIYLKPELIREITAKLDDNISALYSRNIFKNGKKMNKSFERLRRVKAPKKTQTWLIILYKKELQGYASLYEDLKKFLKKYPEDSNALYFLGMYYFEQHEYKLAEEFLLKSQEGITDHERVILTLEVLRNCYNCLGEEDKEQAIHAQYLELHINEKVKAASFNKPMPCSVIY